jgi:hypothetical protein
MLAAKGRQVLRIEKGREIELILHFSRNESPSRIGRL